MIPFELSWSRHIGIQLFYSFTHISSHRLIHFTPLHIATPQSPSFQAPPRQLLAPHVLSGHIPPLIIQFHSSLHLPTTSFNSQVPPDRHPSQLATLRPSGITPLAPIHPFTSFHFAFTCIPTPRHPFQQPSSCSHPLLFTFHISLHFPIHPPPHFILHFLHPPGVTLTASGNPSTQLPHTHLTFTTHLLPLPALPHVTLTPHSTFPTNLSSTRTAALPFSSCHPFTPPSIRLPTLPIHAASTQISQALSLSLRSTFLSPPASSHHLFLIPSLPHSPSSYLAPYPHPNRRFISFIIS